MGPRPRVAAPGALEYGSTVTDETYAAVKRLFLAARAKQPEQREAFLANEAIVDPVLIARVRELLEVDALTEIDAIAADAPFGEPSGSMPASIAGYRVIEELGRGGMGVVYLAERDREGVRQRVALKRMLVNHAVAPAQLKRFRDERRILAALDHPHIARLLDVGADDAGAPYFAMEYVDGLRIDHYVERHALDARQCVELLLKIARAVASAHQRLVVHRDLKPGNILVDQHSEPKLLDFGIAKLLDESEIESSRAETTGGAVLTPRYAAPEQVRGEPVSTATDVYALGVVMFELLTGCSPYGDAVSAPLALPHAICEEDPVAPSVAASRLERSGVRGRPASLDRPAPSASARAGRLNSDLDAIVL